ncbi:hypothetical protein GJ688_02680 [Heliobacillus mobilis]|uniref:Uncharacterized protein n=1 Tax=Heliobacterium mobile TaxID=28064 RepID=A0A6I3SBZ2_HELMO|nr:hypothetical protein [Heliobacterium mobile]MTV47888.1 hypothetical protein [Heliobacterium mobile]
MKKQIIATALGATLLVSMVSLSGPADARMGMRGNGNGATVTGCQGQGLCNGQGRGPGMGLCQTQNITPPPWQGTGRTLSPEERQAWFEGREARHAARLQQLQQQQSQE